jgi:predicted DNA-binding transcriptional regulator YafY
MAHLFMQPKSTTSRIERLETITSMLKADILLTIGDIARETGVSIRTLNRDIQLLRDQGLPIETDIGRGGGIRLDRHWGVGRINLQYSEAVDLLISLAVAEQMDSPLFMAHLKTVRRKLMASFSPAMKAKVKGIKARILISGSASTNVIEKFKAPEKKIVEKLHQAFLVQSQVAIDYEAMNGSITQRTIEPHYLLLNYPVWYVIAWDHLRNEERTFRCDRVLKVRTTDELFKLLPITAFKSSLEGVDAI